MKKIIVVLVLVVALVGLVLYGPHPIVITHLRGME